MNDEKIPLLMACDISPSVEAHRREDEEQQQEHTQYAPDI
jgi:hypothetical protein